MDKLIKIAKLVALVSVAPVAVYVCMFLHQLTLATAELQITVKGVNQTVSTLPVTVDNRLASMQKDVLNKIDTVQDKLTAEVNVLANKTDKRIESVQGDLFKSVEGVRGDVNAQLTTTNKSFDTLVAAYVNIPTQIGARYERDFDSFFNCKKNNLCLQGQTSDTMFAVRDASRSTSLAMSGLKITLPKMEAHALTISNTFATDIPKITGNFASITGNIDRLTKPRWYDRLLGYGLNGVIMYRNLNPATDVSIKGAQIVTGAVTNSIVK